MGAFRFGISEESIRGIRNRTLNREEVLFSVGTPVESLFRVVSGSVRLIAYPQGGKPLVLYRAGEGETFPEDHLICESYRYAAVASEKTTVESIARTLLVRELTEHPSQLFLFLECLCHRFHQLQENFQRVAIPESKLRVLDFLRCLKNSRCGRSESVHLKGKIKSYADDLNLSHEAMYRALRKLEADGCIRRLENGSITVQ